MNTKLTRALPVALIAAGLALPATASAASSTRVVTGTITKATDSSKTVTLKVTKTQSSNKDLKGDTVNAKLNAAGKMRVSDLNADGSKDFKDVTVGHRVTVTYRPNSSSTLDARQLVVSSKPDTEHLGKKRVFTYQGTIVSRSSTVVRVNITKASKRSKMPTGSQLLFNFSDARQNFSSLDDVNNDGSKNLSDVKVGDKVVATVYRYDKQEATAGVSLEATFVMWRPAGSADIDF